MIIFKTIIIKNFLSIGNIPLKLKLNRGNLNLISGEVGVGKSLLIDAITFVLFGSSYRKIKKKNLVNVINEKNLIVEINFQKGEDNYIVKRGINPDIFEIYKNDILLEYDGGREYQQKLENILGFSKLMFTQIFCVSGMNYTPFFNLSSVEKEKIKEKIFSLHILNESKNVTKDYYKKIVKKLDEINSRIYMYNEKNIYLDSLLKDVENFDQNEILQLKKENEEMVVKKKKIEKMIEKIDIKDLRNERNEIKENIYELRQKIINLEKEKQNLNKDICPCCKQKIIIKDRDKKLKNIENQFKKINIEKEKLEKKLRNVEEDYNKYREKLEKLNNNYIELKSKINNNLNRIKDLEKKNKNIVDKYKKELEKNKILIKKLENENKKYKEKKEIFEVILLILDNKGIKHYIIKKYLPLLNKYFIDYLSKLNLNYYIELDEKLNLRISNNLVKNFDYNNFSSGERTKINISLMFAFLDLMMNIFNIKINLMFFDEIFDASFDDETLELILNILKDKNLNIFVISHRLNNITKYDKIFKVKKVNKFTKYYLEGDKNE